MAFADPRRISCPSGGTGSPVLGDVKHDVDSGQNRRQHSSKAKRQLLSARQRLDQVLRGDRPSHSSAHQLRHCQMLYHRFARICQGDYLVEKTSLRDLLLTCTPLRMIFCSLCNSLWPFGLHGPPIRTGKNQVFSWVKNVQHESIECKTYNFDLVHTLSLSAAISIFRLSLERISFQSNPGQYSLSCLSL